MTSNPSNLLLAIAFCMTAGTHGHVKWHQTHQIFISAENQTQMRKSPWKKQDRFPQEAQ